MLWNKREKKRKMLDTGSSHEQVFKLCQFSGYKTIKLIILETYEKWNCFFSPGVYSWTRRVKFIPLPNIVLIRTFYRCLKSNKSPLRFLSKLKAKLWEGVSVEHVRRNLNYKQRYDVWMEYFEYLQKKNHDLCSRLYLSN